jgi:hypothetical protein
MWDTYWDHLTKELWARRLEWSPYFIHAIPEACIEGSTSSGVDWSKGLPQIVLAGLRREFERRDRVWYWKRYLDKTYGRLAIGKFRGTAIQEWPAKGS